MKIYAHRGASGLAPENTMSAFQLAAEMKAEGIELDVQLTKDGGLVVFHDDSMKRTAKGPDGRPVQGMVKDYTVAEIRQMEAGGWFGEVWTGEHIPTLEEVFGWMQGNDLALNIEIKIAGGDYKREIVEKTIALAQECGVAQRLLISSFHHQALVDAKEICPAIPVGILYSESMYRAEQYADIVGAEALHPWFVQIDAAAVKACHEAGKKVNVWTPNSNEELQACFAMGVDAIITNFPNRALALREKKENEK